MSKHRKYRLSIDIISILLILLFVYTAVSKLSDFETFRGQMKAQPVAGWISSIAVWTLPSVEMITGILLTFSRTRLIGLCISLALMLTFTGYVSLALAGAFGTIPCSCGGIIGSLSWQDHLAVNLVFTGLSLTGIVVFRTQKKTLRESINRTTPWQPRRGSGVVAYRSGKL